MKDNHKRLLAASIIAILVTGIGLTILWYEAHKQPAQPPQKANVTIDYTDTITPPDQIIDSNGNKVNTTV